MWKVTCYKNTGMNSVNTIDKPARLSNANSLVLPVLDILQGEFLNSITVKATRDQVTDVDFVALQNEENINQTYFYSVEAFTATSVDVQRLSIVFDALLTLEFMVDGIDKVKFLDGIVERHHIAKDDDIYGAYTENDPLLVPSKELGFKCKQFYNMSGTGGTVVRSTVDLHRTAASDDAITYADENGNSVTVPTPAKPIESNTIVSFHLGQAATIYDIEGVALYDGSSEITQRGIQRLRNLGIEQGAITASYRMRKDLDYTEIHTGEDPRFDAVEGVYSEGPVSTGDFSLDFEYDTSVKNKRVLYGNCNMYEMISTSSGMRMSFKPEDLCLDANGDILESPIAFRVTDPRPEGRPYYGFKYYRGVNQASFGYFANAVAGSQWASSPMVYTGASGSSLNETRYTTEMEGSRLSADQNIASINADLTKDNIRRVGSFLKTGAVLASSAASGNLVGASSSARDLVDQTFTNVYERSIMEEDAAFHKTQIEEMYSYNAKKELMELKIKNTIVAPDLHFPNSETLRDFLGNGVYVIQYRPQNSDRQKLDKILEMYGYKDTKSIDTSDFTNRSKFNYVQATNVNIGGDIPKWIREAAKSQLSNGVRIWHQLPDVTAYTDGSNV